MVSGNAENKSAFENGIFLKVDSVEPVYNITFSCSGEPPLSGIKVWINGSGYFFPCDHYTVCNPDAATEDGRRQALALVKRIYDMSYDERGEAFGRGMFGEAVADASYDDLVKKLEDWKKRTEIRVRDEVVSVVGRRFVVTVPPHLGSNSLKYFSGIAKDGTVYRDQPVSMYMKTGLHVDDLDEYLEV